jgi:hypothetical protein
VDSGGQMTRSCGDPSPASMRGGALVGAFDLTRSGIEELRGEHIHVFMDALS